MLIAAVEGAYEQMWPRMVAAMVGYQLPGPRPAAEQLVPSDCGR